MLKTLFEGSSKSPSYPKSIAGLEVTSVVDLTLGYDSTNPPTYKPSLPLSSGHMIQFRAASKEELKVVLTTRTSGTEPKVRIRELLVGLKCRYQLFDRSSTTWREVDRTVMLCRTC